MKKELYSLQIKTGQQQARIGTLENQLEQTKQQSQFSKDRLDCERDAKFKAE